MKFLAAALLCFVGAHGSDIKDSSGRNLKGSQSLPSIVNVGRDKDASNSHLFPLPECWGDCDGDSDCEGNLVCCHRETSVEVPGCSGNGWQGNNFDYCVQADNCEGTTDETGGESGDGNNQGNDGGEGEGTGNDGDGGEDDPAGEGTDNGGDGEGTGSDGDGGEDDPAGEGTDGGEETNEPPLWSDHPWQFLPFCQVAEGQEDYVVNNCKANEKNEDWARAKYGAKQNNVDITFYDRPLEGECGPHCRPSCVTLMLDLDEFDHYNDLRCNANSMCQCSHTRQFPCEADRLDSLFEEFPKCYLENADCLGPTVFDDEMAFAEMLHGDVKELNIEHCTNIPAQDHLCRFQEWDLVTPIERYSCEDEEYPECLNRDRRIYWEFCNIVEEDPFCDVDENCDGDRCGQDCQKKTEPFANGWTTFTVTTPIPLDPSGQSGLGAPFSNDACNEVLPLAAESKEACFMQRVEFYFPPDDEDCGTGCPNCHECPLLTLGDKFGPLEVVGFGHCIQRINEEHTCNSCDSPAYKNCEKGCELDCDDLFSWGCEQSVDCHTQEEMGFLNFEENQCSWRVNKELDTDSPGDGLSFANEALMNPDEDPNLPAIIVPAVLGLLLCCCLAGACWRGKKRTETEDKRGDDSDESDNGTLPVSNLGEVDGAVTTLAFYNNHDRSAVEGDEISVMSEVSDARRTPQKKKPLRVDWTGATQ